MSELFKIVSIKNVNFGETNIVRASIHLELLPHGIILKDCLLKDGQFGFFLSSPSKKLEKIFKSKTTGKEYKYMDLAFFPKAIREELNRVCEEAYDSTVPIQQEYSTHAMAAANGQTMAVEAVEMAATDDLEGMPA